MEKIDHHQTIAVLIIVNDQADFFEKQAGLGLRGMDVPGFVEDDLCLPVDRAQDELMVEFRVLG